MNTHDYRIDRLRLLACFGVVIYHSSTGAGFSDPALNAVFLFCVPVFAIISGWFQLTGTSTTKQLLCKCVQLFCKMLLWSGIHMSVFHLIYGTWPEDLILYLFTEPIHLWYLYATIGLYLLTPALRPFVRSAEKSEYHYALAICFILGTVILSLVRLNWFPILSVIMDKSKLPQMVGFLYLYLLGGYFRRFGITHRRWWVVIGILCAMFNVYVTTLTKWSQLRSFLAPNVVLSGASCFVIYMTRKPLPDRCFPILRRASECTMGIYLIHLLISSAITPLIQDLRSVLFPAGYMIVRCICVFTVSLAIIWPLSRVKLLKKILL